jgi:hypothetical protein
LEEVRPFDTTELGVPHPTGVAYDAATDRFAIAAVSDGSTKVALTSPFEDPLGATAFPASDPATLATDPASGTVGVLAGEDRVSLPSGDAATPGAVPGRAQVHSGVSRPAGAAYDDGGVLFVLDPDRRAIVRVGPGGSGASDISLAQLPGGVPLRGLAVNRADGLLYVGSPTEQRVYGVDTAGTLQQAYDLSSLGLADQQGFTFAPSADTTDDPNVQHLFVADGGGNASLGSVIEASVADGGVSALAAAVPASLVQRIATSAWSPGSPDPSGIEYVPGADRFVVVDSEVDEVTGAGYHNVNLWQVTRGGAVTDTGTTWTPAPGYSKEPTGLGYDAGSNTLFVSDDSFHRIWIDKTGPDNRFGTADDVVTSLNPTVYGSNDTEDPEFDPATGHLFFIDGVNVEVYDIDPVDGVFGNGNDTMTHFDMAQYGPNDIEGLGSDPVSGNLLVGGRTTKKIYEVTKQGALVQTIDASGVAGLRYISGLVQAPASDGSGRRNYWTVDRNIDNGSNSGENDGQLFEMSIPSAGNAPPVANAGADQTISAPTTSANLNGSVVDDGLPNPPAATTKAWSQVSGPATVTFGTPGAPATTANGFTAVGDYVLRLTANDSALSGSDDVVVHVVPDQPPTVDAGPDQTISAPLTSANLAGSVTDDGFPNPPGATTKTWTRVSGPTAVTFGDASNPVTTANGMSAVGDYVLGLTANDGSLSTSDQMTVHVVANQPPVVNAGPDQTITLPTSSTTLTGSVSDDGFPNPPGATTKTWTRVSGPTAVTFGDASNPATTVSGLTAGGDYVLRLSANDGGVTVSDDLTVHVVDNQPPGVNAGPDQTITQPASAANLSGAVLDDGKPNPPGATTKTWTRVSGPTTVTFGDASNPVTTVSGMTAAGDYVLRLTANDGALNGSDDVTVHVVANQAPGVNAGPDQTITLPTSAANLSGAVLDDGKPNPPGATTKTWTRVSGPTTVTFGDASNPVTTVSGMTAAGDYVLRLTANDGALGNFDDLTVHVTTGGTFTLDAPAAAGSDDAEQATSGSVNITSTDLDMMVDGTTAQAAVGLRFPNLTVPPGATIQSAYVQFRVDETGSSATSLLVQGQAVDNAPTFTTQKNNITSRARTTASAGWNPAAWPTTLAHGAAQQTSDLAPIVQELVLRPGWANGNAVALILTGSGQRVADSTEGAFAPVLHVVYSTGGPAPNQRPVVNAGNDQTVTLPAAAALAGSATDDGLPNPPAAVVNTWTQVSGPGTATFADPHAAATSATFDLIGTYVLRLSSTDSLLTGIDDVTVTVLGPGSLVTRDFPIAVGSDDAEQLASTSVNITSSDLDMMLDGTAVQSAVGLRFANVTLPPGAAVVSASVQFRSDEATADATSLLIQGQAALDPSTFTTLKNGITSRPRTAASVGWNPAAWTKTSETGPSEQTGNLVSIVQELVSQPGWTSGNAMVLIVTGSGRRVADSFEGSAPAVLHVVYQL